MSRLPIDNLGKLLYSFFRKIIWEKGRGGGGRSPTRHYQLTPFPNPPPRPPQTQNYLCIPQRYLPLGSELMT
jgi:hypothetical protein